MLKKVSATLSGVIGKASKKYGLDYYDIIINWHNIVGVELAQLATPVKINFRNNDSKNNGTLIVGVEHPAFSLEVQNIEEIIIERIAQYFGYRLVSRVKVGVTHAKNFTPNVRNLIPARHKINQDDMSEIMQAIGSMPDSPLRNTLSGLASEIFEPEQ